MRMSRFQKLLSIIFLLAALLIAGNAWLAFRAEQVLARSERWVTHTLEILVALERSMRTAYDAESSVRGYVLSGDARYLGGYTYAVTALPEQFRHLQQETSDNPSQSARLGVAGTLAQQKMDRLGLVVALRRNNQMAEQEQMLAQGKGRELMSRLNDTVQDAETEERRLLAIRLRDSAKARVTARLTVGVASMLDILFVAFSLWSLAYERRLRHRAAETSSRLEKLQSVTDVAFSQLTVSELTAELLSRLRRTAQTDVLAIYRWYGTEVELVAAEGTAVRLSQRRAVRADGALAGAAKSGTAVHLAGDSLHLLPVELLGTALGAALVVPMAVGDQVIAVLVAGRTGDARFSSGDESLLSLAADRIAVALDRAAAYEAERAARRRAEASAAEVQQLNAVLEERVQQRTAELESTNRELEAFSYSVSHDLRAPLRTVDGFSVALAEDYGALLEGDGQHYLGRIRAGVQRMGQLIDALLQLSRITRAEFSTEHVDLSTLASDVAEEITQGLPGRRIHFSIEPGLKVEGDGRLLRVIFENMFGNAAKFTGKVPEAEVAFGWSPERNAFFIRDNGAGFDQHYAGKLFVAFQRLHGDKDFQGSGIGLATVGRVIARHHGTITAEGKVGHGATFWFTLG